MLWEEGSFCPEFKLRVLLSSIMEIVDGFIMIFFLQLQPPQPEEWEEVEVSTWPCPGPAQLPLCFASALLPPALTTASFANQ